MENNAPNYKHDCSACMFIKSTKDSENNLIDLYYHDGKSALSDSIILRYSSKPENYSSLPISILEKINRLEAKEAHQETLNMFFACLDDLKTKKII